MNKSKILKGTPSRAHGIFRPLTSPGLDTFVSADVRNYHAHKLLASSARGLIQYLYPPLMSLHDLNETIALPDPVTNRIKIPSLMRNSHMFMGSNGVYLLGRGIVLFAIRDKLPSIFLDNGEAMMIWIGSSASPQVLLDLFGVDDINQVNPRTVRMVVAEVRPVFQTNSTFRSRSSQNWTPHYLSRSETSLLTEEFRGEELQSCPSSGKTWMAPKSSSVTCWWKTRIMGRSHI